MFYPQDVMQDYGSLSDRHTALESALVSTALFHTHRLRLYRQDIFFLSPSRERIDYLVVKDHIPVLKVILSPWRPESGRWYTPGTEDEPALLVVCTKKPRLQDLVDDVTAHLEPLLKSPDRPYQKRDDYVPVPPEHHEAMARLHMIQKQEDHIWARTGYGDWLGVMDGYIAGDNGKPCHTFFIPSERSAELYRAINWEQICREEPNDATSLAQRLERISQGLPLNNASAIEMVRAFGTIPMTDYMASDPETAEELCRQFGATGTFQEAADRIFQFYVGPNNRYDRMELVAALALPLFNIHEGEAPVNQATEPVLALLNQPFPSVLMGAAMAAGQPRLVWNTQRIKATLNRDISGEEADKLLTTTCWKVLRSMRTDSDEDAEISIDMFVRLIVEPFAMLNRAATLQTE